MMIHRVLISKVLGLSMMACSNSSSKRLNLLKIRKQLCKNMKRREKRGLTRRSLRIRTVTRSTRPRQFTTATIRILLVVQCPNSLTLRTTCATKSTVASFLRSGCIPGAGIIKECRKFSFSQSMDIFCCLEVMMELVRYGIRKLIDDV